MRRASALGALNLCTKNTQEMKINFGTIAALAAAYYFVIKPRLQNAPRTGGGVQPLPNLQKILDTGNVTIVPSAGTRAGAATKTGSGQPRQIPEPPVIELPPPKPPAKTKRVNLLPAAASRR
jgi:hypothetical protein